MIQLSNICKTYTLGDTSVKALKNVSLQFDKGEFVSVLGPSGCGKTTLLNILGGLDRYDSGDIIINGRSTKSFSSSDWDSYRNHSIGFVFQSYNLISHQTVLANVELALTIAGVKRAERRERAIEALKRVGLGNELKKKPNQLSGGQMQRVAIARALINDPDILLADEPTGALDSETSVQVMELLKEVSKDRLVIMVTHNGELAEQYSTRIIRLTDGTVINDSNPCLLPPDEKVDTKKAKKDKTKSMSLKTAFLLSLNNLLTKKGRTVLTSFAGSIGIIGIALILALSNGFQGYIDRAQEETLSTYPLSIPGTTMDSAIMISMGEESKEEKDGEHIYADSRLSEMFNAMQSGIHINDLKAFKEFIESEDCKIKENSTVQYKYNLNLDFYVSDTSDGIVKADSVEIMDRMYEVMVGKTYTEMVAGMSGMMGGLGDSMTASNNMWAELMDDQKLLDQQYTLVEGKWPENYNEVVIAVNSDLSINDFYLYALGLKPREEFEENLQKMKNGETLPVEHNSYSFDEILNLNYKLVLNCDKYAKENGVWVDKSTDTEFFKNVIDNSITIKIVGIIKPAENSIAQSLTGLLGYRPSLVNEVVERTNNSAIVKEQKKFQNTDVFTSYPFVGDELLAKWDTMTVSEKWDFILPYLGDMSQSGIDPTTLTDEMKEKLLNQYSQQIIDSLGSYKGNMEKLGAIDLDSPKQINIFPTDFAAKDTIKDEIKRYNKLNVPYTDDDGKEINKQIKYTDFLDLMLSTISTIINAISYVLIAFVSISLIVSSIMIGVITYISVLERTKEIGILRAVGASKRDISRVFNAETFIVGLVSGLMGIGITVILTVPINIFINTIAEIGNIAALPLGGGIILVIISVVLTVIAGLVPSRIAANKDPVVALRTE